MSESRVLVAGATGQLGSVIVRKLVAAGIPVRALARNREKLQKLAGSGVEIAPVDLLDVKGLTEACKGVSQIVSTANNSMGKGPTSPRRIDLSSYQNLCAAARNTRVSRLVFISTTAADQDAPVDLFRVKWYIEDAIKRSGVPYVILRSTAFMDVWVDALLADGIRKTGTTTIFGDGSGVANYIAVDDVAAFVVKVLQRDDVVKEVIDIGGPSNIALKDVAALLEKRLKASGKRRHIPQFVLKYLPPVVKPFNEVAARMMTLGYFATLQTPFAGWKKSADRFGVAPRTIEQYVQNLNTSS